MSDAPLAAPEVTPLLSASQISLYTECARKWAFKYIAGFSEPQGDAAKLGDDIDGGQLQPYLTQGREFNLSRDSGHIAAAGLAYLPPPGTPGLECQKHILIPAASSTPGRPAPFGYQGHIDLWLPNGGAPGIDGGYPTVVDFKSTRNIYAPWVKTPATLATDPQAMLYATWAMFATGARTVDLAWLYMQTKGPRKAKRVHLRVVAADVVREFRRIDALAAEMQTHVKAGEGNEEQYPLSLPPNPNACESFGGCPHRATCNLGPEEIIDAMAARAARESQVQMSNTPSTGSLFARMQQKATEPATPPPAPAPAPAAIVAGGDLSGTYSPPTVQKAAQPPPHFGAPETVPPVAQVPPALMQPTYQSPYGGVTAPVGINPPEAALPPAPIAPVVPPAPVAEEPTKRGPGRPRGSKNAPKDPLGADAHAFTEAPTDAPAAAPVASGAHITVTWGKELYQPIPFNSFEVGPFVVTGRAMPGETTAAALARLNAELEEFATGERKRRAEAFMSALGVK